MRLRLTAILFLFLTTVFAQKISEAKPAKNVAVPYSQVEIPPAYPGCSDTDPGKIRSCTAKQIKLLFEEHFAMQKMETLGLKPGRYRTSVHFRINIEGMVKDIKVNNYREVEEIEAEAVRVAQLLPDMKPGKRRGEIVDVFYGLPIVFDIEPERKRQRKKG
jgi:protein TonB